MIIFMSRSSFFVIFIDKFLIIFSFIFILKILESFFILIIILLYLIIPLNIILFIIIKIWSSSPNSARFLCIFYSTSLFSILFALINFFIVNNWSFVFVNWRFFIIINSLGVIVIDWWLGVLICCISNL